MNTPRKEGAGRPLYSRVPISPAGPTAATPPPPALPAAPAGPAPGPGYLPAALLSYPLAYFYTRCVLFQAGDGIRWGMPLFALLYLLGVGLFARAQKRPAQPEARFWAVCWLVQNAAIALHGPHPGASLEIWQWLAWHAAAVLWTMARTGMLAAGVSGLFTPLDLLAGVTVLPWRDFLLRLRALYHGLAAALRSAGSARRKRLLGGAVSAALALAACLFAGNQLAGVDASFAALFDRLLGWLRRPFACDPESLLYLATSLPVGAWLFGLAGGGLRRAAPPWPQARLRAALAAAPRLPASAGWAVPGALCGVYTLFFALQTREFAAALAGGTLSAVSASAFAVTGFWELCRILLLDFAVLAALQLFGAPLRTPGRRRTLLTLFAAYGLAFALLAAAKLGAYLWLYGPTPRRMLAGWVLAVLALCCVLALVWLWRPLPAARIAVLALAGSFALFCCLPLERLCIDENLRRYETGRIETVDAGLLRQCQDGGQGPLTGYLARRLLDAGWFAGRSADEISQLFYLRAGEADAGGALQNGAGSILLSDLPGPVIYVELTFRQGLCTAATLRTG